MDLSLFTAGVLVVAGILAFEVGISTAITEIIAGVLLALFVDVTHLDWLEFLAHLGMLGLMFMAGFEIDPIAVSRGWRATLGIGLVSFAAPFAGIYAVCTLALELTPHVSALVGIGLSTTSLALVFAFLRERDLLDSDVGQTLLGAASVVDVTSMVALALVFGSVGWATGIFLLAALPAAVGLPRLGRWVFARYRENTAEFELRFILLLLVGMGFLAERVGVHAAIVAFAAGVVFQGVINDHRVLEEKLKGVVFSFFAPVFFLRAGTLLDLRGIDAAGLGVTALLLVVAVSMKFLGTTLPARVFAPQLGQMAGALFNYRLSFGIIAASVGLQAGLLDARMFSAMLLVVLVSAAVPMILLRELPHEI